MEQQILDIDLDLIAKLDRNGPRYTSYPTAVEFHAGYDETSYRRSLALVYWLLAREILVAGASHNERPERWAGSRCKQTARSRLSNRALLIDGPRCPNCLRARHPHDLGLPPEPAP